MRGKGAVAVSQGAVAFFQIFKHLRRGMWLSAEPGWDKAGSTAPPQPYLAGIPRSADSVGAEPPQLQLRPHPRSATASGRSR